MEKSYTIVRDQESAVELANYIKSSGLLAFDIETDSLNPRTGTIIGFSVSANIGEGYYFPTKQWSVGGGKLEDLYIGDRLCDDIAKSLIKLLVAKKLVTHNGSFDTRFVKKYYGVDLSQYIYCDTMLLRHTLKEEGPFGLKEIAIELQENIGLDARKLANEEQIVMKESIKSNGGSVTKTNYEIYKADLEPLGQYAAADTDLTLRIMTYYLPILKEEGLWEFFFEDEVMPLYRTVVIGMEERGCALNIPLIERTRDTITVDMDKLESDIIDDLMSIPQVRGWLIDKALKLYPPSKRGGFAKAIRELPNPADPHSIAYLFQNKKADVSCLSEEDVVRTSMLLWKRKNGTLINIKSKLQLSEIVFGVLEIKPLSQTRKGRDQFDDNMIEHLSSEFEWARKLRDYNKLTKIRSTYIERFLEGHEEGRYYFYVKQHGTTSGRFSSDSQQMPRILEEGEASELVLRYNNILRSFIQAEEGRKLVICDQSSLEPRVFASVSNDPNLINVFIHNEDLYSRVAIQAFRLQGLSAKKEDDNYVKKIRPELRQRAKSIALAIPYGAGAWQIGQSLGIPIPEAQRLIDGYLDGFPELAKWMSETHIRVQTFGYVKSRMGRIRHLPRAKEIYGKLENSLLEPGPYKMLKSMCKGSRELEKLGKLRSEYKNSMNNAKNFCIQSLAASIMNRSAIAIHKEFRERGLDANIMLQIHDEFVINCAAGIAEEVSNIVKHHMESTVTIPTGLVAEPNIATDFSAGHI